MNFARNVCLGALAIYGLFAWLSLDPLGAAERQPHRITKNQSGRSQDGYRNDGNGRRMMEEDEEARPQRIAILYDCSLSMDLIAADRRPRRLHAQMKLAELLDRLPDRTEFVFVAFNETCLPLRDQMQKLNPRQRREILQFSQNLTPRGDTLCADNVALVARRWPRLDAVFLITDARTPQRGTGERQALALGRVQQHYGFALQWLIVDPPATGNLVRMLHLSRGERW